MIRWMDMKTLLAWRTTSRANYREVIEELRTHLHELLAHFVPVPTSLLALSTRTRALLSGEVAIHYLLRDHSRQPLSLDIHVGSVYYDLFIANLYADPNLFQYRVASTTTHYSLEFISVRQMTTTHEITLANGRVIRIHSSSTISASHSMASSPTTAGITFLTEDCFATAYACLTLNRRALVCGERLGYILPSEQDVCERLLELGFSFEEDPSAWKEYSAETLRARNPPIAGCCRPLFVCPRQGRYFGDRGSLVVFYDTLHVDFCRLKAKSVPPYGIMASWRLLSIEDCEEQCDEYDDILEPGVLMGCVMTNHDIFRVVPSKTTDPLPYLCRC